MKKTVAMTAACVIGLATAALAHKGASGIVKERMVAMSAMGSAVKTVAPMMSGAEDYNGQLVRGAAAIIAEHAGTAMTDLFPKDGANMASYVKPAVWEDWDTFAALAKDLQVYADALAMAAADGIAPKDISDDMMDAGTMMGTAPAEPVVSDISDLRADALFAKISDTCASCHTQFRSKAE